MGQRPFDYGIADPSNTNNIDRFQNVRLCAEETAQKVVEDGAIADSNDIEHINGVPVKEGYYAIAMFMHKGEDFHFCRQNSDGSWSQSSGTNSQVS